MLLAWLEPAGMVPVQFTVTDLPAAGTVTGWLPGADADTGVVAAVATPNAANVDSTSAMATRL